MYVDVAGSERIHKLICCIPGCTPGAHRGAVLLYMYYIGRGRDLVAWRVRVGPVDSAAEACRVEWPLSFQLADTSQQQRGA